MKKPNTTRDRHEGLSLDAQTMQSRNTKVNKALPYNRSLKYRLLEVPITLRFVTRIARCNDTRLNKYFKHGGDEPLGLGGILDIVIAYEDEIKRKGCFCSCCAYNVEPSKSEHFNTCERRGAVWKGAKGCLKWQKRIPEVHNDYADL